LFGDVVNGKMVLNVAGKIANECWLEIPEHFPNVILHEYIVMPNHIHGI
jgi:REP element-mobilizing transposase RayT